MKRRILPLALALVCALPLAAQADGVRPTVEITDNHGIHQYTDAAGDSYEIASVTLETQPETLPAGCATGDHAGKTYTDAPVTRHNGFDDPNYPMCILETRRNWVCADCGTEGIDISARNLFCGCGGTKETDAAVPFIVADTDASN